MNTENKPEFPKHLYDGDTFDYKGRAFKVTFTPDYDHGAPWEENDGEGIVESRRGRDKKPGERVLHVADHNYHYFFDWQGTIAKAKEEGWGLCDEDRLKLEAALGRLPTPKEVIAASVERTFQWYRKFLRDDWAYVGVTVTSRADDGFYDSLWGVEYDTSDPKYAMEIVRECADNVIALIETAEKEKAEAEAAAQERYKTLEMASVRVGMVLYEASKSMLPEQCAALKADIRLLREAAGLKVD